MYYHVFSPVVMNVASRVVELVSGSVRGAAEIAYNLGRLCVQLCIISV